MKTQDFPRKPRPARPHFPSAPAAALPAPAAHAGDWRYASAPKTRGATLLAVAAAAGLHAAMFYGFSPPPARRAVAAPVPVPAAIEIALPPLPPEEAEEQPRELVDAPAVPAVPQLADVPTSVALSDFAQALDLRPRAEVDVGALKSMTIPVSRGRGGAGPGPAGAIFNLSQLDRVPQPVAQPSPSFPKGVRIAGLEQAVVVVEFIVDAEGRVLEPRVTRSNAPEFDRAALAGVARWKFRPGILSGRKVATRMKVPLKFDLTARE